MSFDYDVTGSRDVSKTSSSANAAEVRKSSSKQTIVKSKPKATSDRAEFSGDGKTNGDASGSAEKDNSAQIVQERERIEMYQLRNEIKDIVNNNIDKLVALDTGDVASRAQYRAELENMIKAAVQKRVASAKTNENVTASEQKVIDTLMLGASKYDSQETLQKLRKQFREMFEGLSDKEHAKYDGVRTDIDYKKYMGSGAPEKLVQYMVKQQFGDYSSGKSDELENIIDSLTDMYTRQVLQGIDEPIDIEAILKYERKEVVRRRNESLQKERNDSLQQRAKLANNSKEERKFREKQADVFGVNISRILKDE